MLQALSFLLLFASVTGPAAAQRADVVGHELDVLLTPTRGSLAVRDTLTLPANRRTWTFALRRGLNPQVSEGQAELKPIDAKGHLEFFRLQVLGPGPVSLRYAGSIRDELQTLREGIGRSREVSRGTISEEGVFLDSHSGWYPRAPDSLNRFSLRVQVPLGWTAVSQGVGPDITESPDGASMVWRETLPQDDIYLVAAPFHRYVRATPHGEAQVYLRSPDAPLAERYLEATDRYLDLYSRLIGPYPYAKFALIENFWETGYGMPSFTLLGPRVIRLPFILHTSYPHEILHNWWGNGVFVDYEGGNWSEGLTAYLSDHLLREQRGRGADYRRDSLKSYADYVRAEEDYPIRAFRGRHGSASQAIGYGKTLMVLHMLRRDLGDQVFLQGLRRFYQDNQFRAAGFRQLKEAFEVTSGRDLSDFLDPWIGRTGAPRLGLSDVQVEAKDGGFLLTGRIEQLQNEAPFPLEVPLAIHLEDGGLLEPRIALADRSTALDLQLSARPIRVDLDPRFDLFRQLAPGETPVTLSALFGAKRGVIIVPSAAAVAVAEGYGRLAATWMRGSSGWEVVRDDQLDALPAARAVWVLGWENRFLPEVAGSLPTQGLDPAARHLEAAGQVLGGAEGSLALALEHAGQPVGVVASGEPDALPGLTRKLPHYGKYSYLGFEGTEPVNRVKGQWPAGESALRVWLTDERPPLELPAQAPLSAAVAASTPTATGELEDQDR